MEVDAQAETLATRMPWSPGGDEAAAITMQLLGAMLPAELQTPQPNLPELPTTEIHAPTLLSAIGVIAGYAAQCAAADAVLRNPRARQPGDLVKVQCKDGSALYFGQAIDRHIVLDRSGTLALAGFLAGAVIAAEHELTDAAEILRHVKAVSCTPEFDLVRAPSGYAPLWNVSQILKAIWPKARVILEHRLAPARVQKPLDVQHWPIAASLVAQQYIGFAKDIVPPPVAMSIVFELALKASKRRLIGSYASGLAMNDDVLFKPEAH